MCSTHDLTDLDSLIAAEHGRRSVLDFIVHEGICECFTEVIDLLLDDKWNEYGAILYYSFLGLHVFDLIILCFFVTGKVPFAVMFVTNTIVHTVNHTLTIATGQWNSERQAYLWQYFLDRFLSIAYCITLFITFVVYLSTSDRTCGGSGVDYCYSVGTNRGIAISSVLAWLDFLYCLRPIQFTGVSILMMRKMIVGDTLKFGILYCCVLMGFTQAIYIQYSIYTDAELAGTSAAGYNEFHEV